MEDKDLQELEEYRKIGTPAKIREDVHKFVEAYKKVVDSFNNVKEMINVYHSLVFCIVKDKLIAEGKLLPDADENTYMHLVVKEFEEKYKTFDTTEMRQAMLNYARGGDSDEKINKA